MAGVAQSGHFAAHSRGSGGDSVYGIVWVYHVWNPLLNRWETTEKVVVDGITEVSIVQGLILLNPIPTCCCMWVDSAGGLYWGYSTNGTTPSGTAQFVTYALDTDVVDMALGQSLNMIFGLPIATYTKTGSPTKVRYAAAKNPFPTSAPFWEFSDICEADGYGPSIYWHTALPTQVPIVSFKRASDNKLMYYQALSASPTSEDQWFGHTIDDCGAEGNIQANGTCLKILQCKPVILYTYNDGSNVTRAMMAYAIYRDPFQTSEWTKTTIKTQSGDNYVNGGFTHTALGTYVEGGNIIVEGLYSHSSATGKTYSFSFSLTNITSCLGTITPIDSSPY